ncbi:MAG: aldose 1-epimerase family protein [Sphingomonas sp.]
MAERQMVEIGNGTMWAAINPYGAELTHFHDAEGRELMTDADPAYWPKHAPILFPVVGETNGHVIRVDGTEYPMGRHGFARDMMFELAEHEPTRAVFQLTDNELTREHYPFAFLLEIAFTLDGTTLMLDARIENRSDGAMPAQFGFHPALAWPLPYGEPRDDHRIVFDTDEPAELLELSQQGLVAEARRASPLDGRELRLRDALFRDDALIWDPVHSGMVRYGASKGPRLEVAFPDTPRLGVWSKPGSRFVCIEPWHGLADPDGFTGELRDKPGVFEIAPGDEKRIGMSITLAG